MKHEWGPSRLSHGETQCIHCLMTNREAWVLGDECPVLKKRRAPVNENNRDTKS